MQRSGAPQIGSFASSASPASAMLPDSDRSVLHGQVTRERWGELATIAGHEPQKLKDANWREQQPIGRANSVYNVAACSIHTLKRNSTTSPSCIT